MPLSGYSVRITAFYEEHCDFLLVKGKSSLGLNEIGRRGSWQVIHERWRDCDLSRLSILEQFTASANSATAEIVNLSAGSWQFYVVISAGQSARSSSFSVR